MTDIFGPKIVLYTKFIFQYLFFKPCLILCCVTFLGHKNVQTLFILFRFCCSILKNYYSMNLILILAALKFFGYKTLHLCQKKGWYYKNPKKVPLTVIFKEQVFSTLSDMGAKFYFDHLSRPNGLAEVAEVFWLSIRLYKFKISWSNFKMLALFKSFHNNLFL